MISDDLHTLICDEENIKELPKLSNKLKFISCQSNLIDKLPKLPKNLEYLYVSDNFLKELPLLPDSLQELQIAQNQIKTLPNFPTSLRKLNCDYDFILNNLWLLKKAKLEINGISTLLLKQDLAKYMKIKMGEYEEPFDSVLKRYQKFLEIN